MTSRLLTIALVLLGCVLPHAATAATVDLQAYLFVPPTVRAGGNGVWSIGVVNHRPVIPTDWRISFPIPANASFVSVETIFNGSCSRLNAGTATETLECTGPSLGFAGAEFEVTLVISPSASQSIHSMISVSTPSNDDLDPTNNTASGDSTIVSTANVLVGLEHSGITVMPDELVAWRVAVLTTGPDPATGLIMDVTLPPGSKVVSSSWSFDSCTTAPIRCTAAILPVGIESQMALNLSVRAPAIPGTYQSSASVFWTNPWNTAPIVTTLNLIVVPKPQAPDLSVAVDAQPYECQVGNTVTFTINVTNDGDGPAQNVSIHHPLPSSLSFVSASEQCSGAPDVYCNVGNLDSGAWSTVKIVAATRETGAIQTIASATTDSTEPNTNNNSATTTINVTAPQVRRRAAHH